MKDRISYMFKKAVQTVREGRVKQTPTICDDIGLRYCFEVTGKNGDIYDTEIKVTQIIEGNKSSNYSREFYCNCISATLNKKRTLFMCHHILAVLYYLCIKELFKMPIKMKKAGGK